MNFMTHEYTITGMTCGNCVAKAKSELLMLGDVTGAEVQLASPQARVTMRNHIALPDLQKAISKAGNYTITEAGGEMREMGEAKSWFESYKPILIIGAYIFGVTLLPGLINGTMTWQSWMSGFMAAFFLVFSFFKMLDVRGFAESYATYDLVAGRWRGWGYLYPFVELGLGFAFLLRFDPLLTNSIAFAVMTVSIIGVLKSVLNKRTIRCACLGTVFDLPMSTITVIEDALMIAMSGAMIALMIL
jgi:copper chaperone CopZ